METPYIFSQEFDGHAKAAVAEAIQETLRAGIPVYYAESNGMDVMEQPDGRKFEIRYIPGASGDDNVEIIRELIRIAA